MNKKHELEPFVKPNPEAYKRFKKLCFKNDLTKLLSQIKMITKMLSCAILWFCAVGGFILSLIQFFQD